MDVNPLLGFVAGKHGISQDEQDLLEHNFKKVKGNDQNFKQGSSIHLAYEAKVAIEKNNQ